MVGLVRFELTTSRLSSARSNQLSYKPAYDRTTICDAIKPLKEGMRRRRTGWLVKTSKISNTKTRREGSEDRSNDKILRKEVIQPQVPLRLPCYDFAPVTNFTVVGYPLAVSSPTSDKTSSHGVTGGVYKARERIHRSILICDY